MNRIAIAIFLVMVPTLILLWSILLLAALRPPRKPKPREVGVKIIVAQDAATRAVLINHDNGERIILQQEILRSLREKSQWAKIKALPTKTELEKIKLENREFYK